MSAKLTTHQALQKIAEEYEAPIFFDRLKQHGVVPRNGDDDDQLKLTILLEKLNQEKQLEGQSELSQLIGRAIQRVASDQKQHLSVIDKRAFAKMLFENPEMRNAFSIVVQGLAETG